MVTEGAKGEKGSIVTFVASSDGKQGWGLLFSQWQVGNGDDEGKGGDVMSISAWRLVHHPPLMENEVGGFERLNRES